MMKNICRLVAGALLVVLAGVAVGADLGERVDNRDGVFPLFLVDSSGVAITTDDSITIELWSAQCATPADTFLATLDTLFGNWFVRGAPTDYYRIRYTNADGSYFLADSFPLVDAKVARFGVHADSCIADSVVTGRAVASQTINAAHVDSTATYTLTLSGTSVVPSGALTSAVFLDADFPDWFETYDGTGGHAVRDTLDVDIVAANDSSRIAILDTLAVDIVAARDSVAVAFADTVVAPAFQSEDGYNAPVVVATGTTTFPSATTLTWTATATGAATGDWVDCRFVGYPPYTNSMGEQYTYQLGATVSGADTITFYRSPSGTPGYNSGASIAFIVYRLAD